MLSGNMRGKERIGGNKEVWRGSIYMPSKNKKEIVEDSLLPDVQCVY